MSGSADGRAPRGSRLFLAGLLAVSVLGADSVTAQSERPAPGAVVAVYRDAAWYRSSPEPEERRVGILRRREVVAGPASRTALAYELATADAVYPVYAAGKIETLAPIVGRTIEVEAKLVDPSGEGLGKELWIASLRILDERTR